MSLTELCALGQLRVLEIFNLPSLILQVVLVHMQILAMTVYELNFPQCVYNFKTAVDTMNHMVKVNAILHSEVISVTTNQWTN